MAFVLALYSMAGCETVTKATYFSPDGSGITFEKHTPLFVDAKVGHVSLTTRPFGFTMDDFNQSTDPQVTAITKAAVEGAIQGATAVAKP